MTVGMLSFFALILLASSLPYSAYAEENTWVVFLNQYDGVSKTELFAPLELPISSGDKVIWRNMDSTFHKIVSGVPEHPDYSGEFFSTDILSPGDSFSETFADSQYAAYYYFCEIHPWFTGKIFFEDRQDIFHSTLDISYNVTDSETLQVGGVVESDLGNTGYEILVFDLENNLVFQKLYSFEPDASFDVLIDVSSSIWKHDENYLLKLVYGVPSESTELSLNIPIGNLNPELKLDTLNFCNDATHDFVFHGVLLPSWYSQVLCWFGNGLVVEKEISDAVNFFQ